MNKAKFLFHKTGISGDPVDFLKKFNPSTALPLKDWNDEDYPGDPDGIEKGQPWAGTWNTNRAKNQARIRSYRSFLLHDLQGFGGRMTFFWMNHFGVNDAKILDADMMLEYYQLIRSTSVGNFKELILAITINPAMLIRLDGETNKKQAPNVNYARELFELFTLGHGNGYTEQDIKEAGRALTGWEVHNKKAVFALQNWDDGDKTIFGITGQKGVYTLIELLFEERWDKIASFIAKKLVRYFLGAENPVLANDVAAAFYPNWSIKEALITLFTHDEFYNMDYMVVKSPIELLHSLPLNFPNDINFYHVYSKLLDRCEEMGLDIINPPEIEGYKPYRTAPDYDKLWYQGGIGLREKLVDELFDPWKFTMDSKYMFFTDVMNEPLYAGPNEQVWRVVERNLPFEWPSDALNKLKTDTLLSGQSEDRYWTNAVIAYQADPSDRNASKIRERLIPLYQAIFSNPQFQLQ